MTFDINCTYANPQKYLYVRYIVLYCVMLCFFLSPLFINYLLLINSREYISLEKIYEQQNKLPDEEVIYGSRVYGDSSDVKLYAYAKKKPKIVVLGSSRVMQFRESFFSQSFYNLGFPGRTMLDPEVVANILSLHVPEVVILGVEFAYFNENYKESYNFPISNGIRGERSFAFTDLAVPFTLIKNRRITVKQYVQGAFKKSKRHLGVDGIINKVGISSDGAYHWTDQITEDVKSFKDKNFQQTMDMIKNRHEFFYYGTTFSKAKFQRFFETLDYLSVKELRFSYFSAFTSRS